MVKTQQGEISMLRTENARAVQALREMLNGLKMQVDNIQSQNFTRGTEKGNPDAGNGGRISEINGQSYGSGGNNGNH
jgi:hypothetical protein